MENNGERAREHVSAAHTGNVPDSLISFIGTRLEELTVYKKKLTV